MHRRSFLALSGAGLGCGCSGAVHQLPAISDGNLAAAAAEVEAAGRAPGRHRVSPAEAVDTLRTATHLVVTPAAQLCHEMNVGVCTWKFRILDDDDLNAGALPRGYIVLNRGIVDFARNDEEVCMVVAHEIGHQAANHVAQGLTNQAAGALIGATLAGLLGAAISSGSRNSASTVRSAAQLGSRLGGKIGHLAYSKEQEREADYLAALILYRAGIDLDRARGLLVTLGRLTGARGTSILDSHPAGPERLAGWDRAVAEIRASNGRLPRRAS